MPYKVGTPKIDGRKMLTITDGPKYSKYAVVQARKLRRHCIDIYYERYVGGVWRPSNTSPPKYAESFVVRKVGRNWRLVNEDPGAVWVEFGARAGGTTPILKYAVMRTALDRLEAEERL